MTLLRRTWYAFALFAGAMGLAACSNPALPAPFSSASAQDAAPGHALLYVSDAASGSVSFYSYPGLKFKGKITHFKHVGAVCADPRNGNVWVASGLGNPDLAEFAHGSIKPIRKVKLIAVDVIEGCAVNPTNGDVALTEPYQYDDPGTLLILSNANGKLTRYNRRNLFTYAFVAYDTAGNAFVDGSDGGGETSLDELPKGGKQLVNVTPHHWSLKPPGEGAVQYDGTDLVVGKTKGGRVYQISDRNIVGMLELSGTCLVRQFVIDDGSIIAPSACHSSGKVLIYEYPSGGGPSAEITGFEWPYAVAISR